MKSGRRIAPRRKQKIYSKELKGTERMKRGPSLTSRASFTKF